MGFTREGKPATPRPGQWLKFRLDGKELVGIYRPGETLPVAKVNASGEKSPSQEVTFVLPRVHVVDDDGHNVMRIVKGPGGGHTLEPLTYSLDDIEAAGCKWADLPKGYLRRSYPGGLPVGELPA